MATPWMIYGANGYTGTLIAELAARQGQAPILAGRSLDKVQPLADRLGLAARAFPLDDARLLAAGLEGVSLVLHCAGPFSSTARPMVEACLAAGIHYLDLTGEMDVIEDVLSRAGRARAKGCVLVPAVGFDVVPTDCLAALLHEKLPAATSLELAFATTSRPSQGTAKTAVEMLPRGGFLRRGGKLVRVPAAHLVAEIPFAHRTLTAMSIPWGDLASAWVSTGIPDITVYMAASPGLVRSARLSRWFGRLLGFGPLQRLLKARIEKGPRGPPPDALAREKVELWGRVRDAAGQSVEATLTVQSGYAFTAASALRAAQRVLEGKVPPGAWTPSQAFGKRFVTEVEGTTLRL